MDPNIIRHYASGIERNRLQGGSSRIEFARTKELLERFLPPPPARVLDVGGGPGAYASWLAARGYDVHLIDGVPLHIEQASELAERGPARFTAELGDARSLRQAENSSDAVLLLGPLYHLPERGDRLNVLSESARIVRPGGLIVAAAISRFAGLLDGLKSRFLTDREAAERVASELDDGRHDNPTDDPTYFTTAYFHHPDELPREIADAGLELEGVYGVEGPGWLLWERWDEDRELILIVARALECEPTVIGVSSHLLAVARRPVMTPR